MQHNQIWSSFSPSSEVSFKHLFHFLWWSVSVDFDTHIWPYVRGYRGWMSSIFNFRYTAGAWAALLNLFNTMQTFCHSLMLSCITQLIILAHISSGRDLLGLRLWDCILALDLARCSFFTERVVFLFTDATLPLFKRYLKIVGDHGEFLHIISSFLEPHVPFNLVAFDALLFSSVSSACLISLILAVTNSHLCFCHRLCTTLVLSVIHLVGV